MPLARIITTSAKYSDGLADDLRSRGFQVLTSAPGDNISGSADLEITLNECLAEEARAAADTEETKDMRVFLTPQAFAGKIRSIEMFVLAPKQSTNIKEVTPSADSVSSAATIVEFAAPVASISENESSAAELSSDVTAPEIEFSSDIFEESDEPGFALTEEVAHGMERDSSDASNGMGRTILASKQSAWPDMAEMKLVPAELAPASVRSVGIPIQPAPLPEKFAATSSRSESFRDKRFWKAPIVAGIAAVLALSAVWVANRLSTSQAPAGATVQQPAPTSIEAATPAAPTVNQVDAKTKPASVVISRSPKTLVRTSAATRLRSPRAKTKRHYNSDNDYVAKDTTIYFSKQPAGSANEKNTQAKR